MPARVIVLAGPSGTGKSRLAARLGLPVLRLDDFYKNGDDPTLPRIHRASPTRRFVPRLLRAGNEGLVDWDHPDAWLPADALDTVAELCREGRADVPVYDIAHDGRCGWRVLDLQGSECFLAEGIFAHSIVPECRERGLLAAAYVLRQPPLVTFWRRLTRDLREHRKPPPVLVRRGLALMRDQRHVVADAEAMGCEVIDADGAYERILRALVAT